MDRKIVRQILKKKNVVSVGIGLKETGGKPTNIRSVVVGVSKKVPLSELAAQDVVPETIGGRPSDVVEVGEIRALAGNTTRVRPCPGGVSCGSFRITAGTLGAWVMKGAQPMLLSNNHVLADVNRGEAGDAILQPGKYDGGDPLSDTIAQLDTFVPIRFINRNIWQRILDWIFRRQPPTNMVDCALAAPFEGDPVTSWGIIGIGTPNGSIQPVLGLTVKKSGRTTGLTVGTIRQIDVTAQVNMGDGRIAVFTDQFMIPNAGFSAPGDSGSMVLTEYKAFVGLLFAGSETVTLCNRWQNVRDALGLNTP